MKIRSLLLVAAIAIAGCWAAAPFSHAQLKNPPNPFDVSKRKVGENGGAGVGTGSVGVAPAAAAAQAIVIQYVAVSPIRNWTNADGKTMVARLLAWSAPKDGESGPVEVIREGKVRFLLERGKDPIDYPITQLSQADQIDIKAIAQAASRGAPDKSEADPAEEKKPEAKEPSPPAAP